MEISRRYSRSVYEDALEAVRDPSHPCHHFVQWQADNACEPFQLPEPFSGRRTILGLAFMGLNPSVTHDEFIPCHGEVDFVTYDRYFRARFDAGNRDEAGRLVVRLRSGGTKRPRLWNNIELFGNRFLRGLAGGEFLLGEHAILIQAVRFKSKNGWLGSSSDERRRVREHQQPFTDAILDEGFINVLVPMGNDALDQISEALSFDRPLPTSSVQASGNTYRGVTRAGRAICVCPVKHLSYPPTREVQRRVAGEIMRAVEGAA